MTLPNVLSTPPVKSQDPARCWSAAFESWHEVTSSDIGVNPNVSDDDLHRWFDSGDGLTFTRGSATDRGVRLLANIGMMDRRQLTGHNVTLNYIDRLLDESHIYCGYYWGNNGHACVIYGATTAGFMVMDPARGRGIWQYPPQFFASMSRVVLGTSLMTGLSRSLERIFAGLAPPPVS
ncbi:MAG: hypothetical protein GY947_11500 [Rhodobacteraceae bacterium]|nr:hypothetical protein [Paracoccaceae bacterium]